MPIVTINRPVLDLLAARLVFHRLFEGERWQVGHRLGLGEVCDLEPYSHLFGGYILPQAMGAFSYSHSELRSYVRVGRYCSLGKDIAWAAGDHPTDWATTSPVAHITDGALQGIRRYAQTHPAYQAATTRVFHDPPMTTTIGNDVWIGDQAMIRRGVTIGDGAAVGARALVMDDVAPYAVVGGLPAKVLRPRFPQGLVERFLATAWWRFEPQVIQPLPMERPEAFLDALEALLATAPPAPMALPPLTGPEIVAAAGEG